MIKLEVLAASFFVRPALRGVIRWLLPSGAPRKPLSLPPRFFPLPPVLYFTVV